MKRQFQLKPTHVYLKGGKLFISNTPAIVSTVLGSCVSVTFFSRSPRLGAMCHVLLPTGANMNGFKYEDSTLEHMVERIGKMGINAKSCEVKLFGGANILWTSDPSGNRKTVGYRNISMAYQKLELLGITAVISDVGGEKGRKLLFNTGTGGVLLKRLG